MARVLLVYGNPKHAGFIHSVFEGLKTTLEKAGCELRVRDLYKMGFDPVLSEEDFEAFSKNEIPADIRTEQEHVDWAEYLIFLYPLWWHDRPAILKGWIDRVFSYGYAFGPGGKNGRMKGYLKTKSALVIQTAGSLKEDYAVDGFDQTIEVAMVDGTLKYCGIQSSHCLTLWGVGKIATQEYQEMLERAQKAALSLLK